MVKLHQVVGGQMVLQGAVFFAEGAGGHLVGNDRRRLHHGIILAGQGAVPLVEGHSMTSPSIRCRWR